MYSPIAGGSPELKLLIRLVAVLSGGADGQLIPINKQTHIRFELYNAIIALGISRVGVKTMLTSSYFKTNSEL